MSLLNGNFHWLISKINYWHFCFVILFTLKHINVTQTDGQGTLIYLFFGMLRFQVFFWVCLKYLIYFVGGGSASEIFVGYIADAGAQPIYQEIFRVPPPLGVCIKSTLAKYVKINNILC